MNRRTLCDMEHTLTAPDPPSAPRKRIRNPEAHRAAILEAARATSLSAATRGRRSARSPAGRAWANGLVLRHFGSKENLFMAAMPGPQNLADLVQGDPQTLPERLAHGYLAAWSTPAATTRSWP